jgi:hypothetical protein
VISQFGIARAYVSRLGSYSAHFDVSASDIRNNRKIPDVHGISADILEGYYIGYRAANLIPPASRISRSRINSRPPDARTSYTRAFETVVSHFGPG